MIVNIRGTGGAGKSHIVRQVMTRYQDTERIYEPRRRQPVGYICYRHGKPLYVVGHYETACGGGDTIKTPAQVFETVERYAHNHDVIFEGIIAQDDVVRTVRLAGLHKLLVIALDVPIETCLASIQIRRDERGDVRPLKPLNTVSRAKRLAGIMSRLKDAGVPCKKLGREAALTATLEALEWPTE